MNSMAVFLSKPNFDIVYGLCKGFLIDHMRLGIDESTLQQAVALEMKHVASTNNNNDVRSLDDLNKTVVIGIKNKFTIKQAPEVKNEDKQEDETEQSFFKKLKQVEIQRSIVPSVVQAAPAPVPVSQPQNTPQPAAPQTIIVRESISHLVKQKKHIWCIASQDRLWLYQTARVPFITKSELPHNIDMSSMRICAAIVPQSSRVTSVPFFYLSIEGTGKHVMELVMCVDKVHNNYIELRCPSDEASYMLPLSLPWTVNLFDNFHNQVDIGYDGWHACASGETPNGTTIYKLSHLCEKSHMDSFTAGDVIEIHKDDAKQVLTVKTVHSHSIEVDGVGPQEGYVVNVSRQLSIFVEWTEKND